MISKIRYLCNFHRFLITKPCRTTPFSIKLSFLAKVHYKNAHGLKFNCELCNKEFTCKSYFEQHKKNISFASENLKLVEKCRFQCLHCNKIFCKLNSAKSHQKNFHDGMPKFICDLCNKTFAFKKNFEKHLENLKFTCEYFKLVENCRFQCSHCKKIFSKLDSAKNHYKSVHEGESVCKLCKKRFKTEIQLRNHMKGRDNSIFPRDLRMLFLGFKLPLIWNDL